MDIKERVELLLHFKNLSPSQFAEEIGVQRSGVSHILSGRNKPSLDFVKKIVERFPDVSYNWIIEGSGELQENNGVLPIEKDSSVNQNVDEWNDTNVNTKKESGESRYDTSVNVRPGENSFSKDTSVTTSEISSEGTKKKIKQIIVFYSDGSFESFHP